jgi:hypothetical protein
MADESRVREIVKRYFEYAGADVDRAEEIYITMTRCSSFPNQESGSRA